MSENVINSVEQLPLSTFAPFVVATVSRNVMETSDGDQYVPVWYAIVSVNHHRARDMYFAHRSLSYIRGVLMVVDLDRFNGVTPEVKIQYGDEKDLW